MLKDKNATQASNKHANVKKQPMLRDILSDIEWLGHRVVKFDFYPNRSNRHIGTARMTVMLQTAKENSALESILSRYGISLNRAATTKGSNVVEFDCDANDDIIAILEKAATDYRIGMQAYHAKILQDEIRNVAQQASYARSSVFSRGVKNLKAGVETLNNTVKTLSEYQAQCK